MQKKEHFSFILSMIIFGSNGVFVHFIPWRSYEIVLARTLIGACFMTLLLFLRKKPLIFRKKKKDFYFLILSGMMMGINWMLLYESFRRLGVGLGQMMSSCGPILAMVLSPWIFKEKLQKHKVRAFLFVVLGMLLISSKDLFVQVNASIIYGFLACFTYAAFILCNHWTGEIEGEERTLWQLLSAALVVFLFIDYKKTRFPIWSWESALPLLILGVVNTGFAINLMFRGLQKLSIQTIGILGFLEPLSALVFSTWLLKERMTLLQMVGAAFILGGTLYAEGYRPKKIKLN